MKQYGKMKLNRNESRYADGCARDLMLQSQLYQLYGHILT